MLDSYKINGLPFFPIIMDKDLELRLSYFLKELTKLKQQIQEYSNKQSMIKQFSLLKL